MTDQLRGGTTIGGYLAYHSGNLPNANILGSLSDSGGALLYNGAQVGAGDMTKTEYSSSTGVVKNSAALAGYLPSMVNSNSTVAVRNASGYLYATRVYGAVFNDYAETRRSTQIFKGGLVVTEGKKGLVEKCEKRLSKVPMVVSDTYGFSIGEESTDEVLVVPIAVAGRALVYPDKHRDKFKVGDVVCSGVGGTVSKIKWWEKMIFPERILGVVSEIPDYQVWGTGDIIVDNRIWIKI